ncbi:MAG: HEAT repeat domain-containing protein [Planctomycetota bacterium]|nr:HEAT repeat domain-containing protein [Planctomycetota bacterium]
MFQKVNASIKWVNGIAVCLLLMVASPEALAQPEWLQREKARILAEELHSPQKLKAAMGLVQLGPVARFALPELIEILEARPRVGDNLFGLAMNAIIGCGPSGKGAAPALVRILSDNANGLPRRYAAAHCLWETGAADPQWTPQLVELLLADLDNGDKVDWRFSKVPIIRILEQFGPGGKEAVPGLLQVLKGSNQRLRCPVAQALIRLGQVEEGKLSLLKALKSEDPELREEAASTIGRVCAMVSEPARDQLVQGLQAALGDSVAEVRVGAASALLPIRPKEEVFVVLLEAVRERKDVDKRLAILETFGKAGPLATPVASRLSECLMDREYAVQVGAVEALSRIRPTDYEPVRAILKNGNRLSRVAAAELLVRVGSGAEGLPVLLEALSSQDEAGCLAAADALRRVGPHPGAEEALVRAGDGSAGSLRVACARTLIWWRRPDAGTRLIQTVLAQPPGMAEPARAMVLQLPEDLRDMVVPCLLKNLRERGVDSGVYSVLADMGWQVLPFVIPLLEGQDAAPNQEAEEFRLALLRLTGECGRVARVAVPALVKCLRNQSPSIRAKTLTVLDRLGPDARSALPAVQEALHDKDDNVRALAVEAIKHIEGAKGRL